MAVYPQRTSLAGAKVNFFLAHALAYARLGAAGAAAGAAAFFLLGGISSGMDTTRTRSWTAN